MRRRLGKLNKERAWALSEHLKRGAWVLKKVMNLREVLNEAIALLQESGSESPKLDAQLLLMKVCALSRVQLITHDQDPISEEQYQSFKQLVALREQGHPIAHLLGERDFWDLTLKVTPATLIPRPDTEILVEKALELIETHQYHTVLDLGTGSGAIILALKHSAPYIDAYGVDLSAAALAVAQENASRYNLEVAFNEGSWFEALPKDKEWNGFFDLIVSNPPYIEADDEHLGQGDVRFEPLSALVSGADGLDDIRQIAHEALKYLRLGGYLLFEHGYNQKEAVQAILRAEGYESVVTLQDYGGNDRVTLGYKAH